MILYEDALKAVQRLFSDTTVSKDVTVENLAALKDEISTMIYSIEE